MPDHLFYLTLVDCGLKIWLSLKLADTWPLLIQKDLRNQRFSYFVFEQLKMIEISDVVPNSMKSVEFFAAIIS